MRGERVDNHDKVCCEYYAALLAMGAYDVEFMLFGTVYLEAGRKKCFISADRSVVYQFVEDCRTKGIYPSMVHRKIKRCRVNSGERELVDVSPGQGELSLGQTREGRGAGARDPGSAGVLGQLVPAHWSRFLGLSARGGWADSEVRVWAVPRR